MFAIIFNKFSLCIFIIIILTVFITFLPAIIFQRKKNKKYEECLTLIKEKENGNLNINNGLTKEELEKIDNRIDLEKLMMKLYDTYLEFIEKLNKNDKDFEGILYGFIKEFYVNKINVYKIKKHVDKIDNVELINYSILEYNKKKLKFKVNITCSNYKLSNNEIIEGSNLDRVEQIFIITYVKSKRKWLINNIEKVFEKKLSI